MANGENIDFDVKENVNTGERRVYHSGQWLPLEGMKENTETGARAYRVGGQWLFQSPLTLKERVGGAFEAVSGALAQPVTSTLNAARDINERLLSAGGRYLLGDKRDDPNKPVKPWDFSLSPQAAQVRRETGQLSERMSQLGLGPLGQAGPLLQAGAQAVGGALREAMPETARFVTGTPEQRYQQAKEMGHPGLAGGYEVAKDVGTIAGNLLPFAGPGLEAVKAELAYADRLLPSSLEEAAGRYKELGYPTPEDARAAALGLRNEDTSGKIASLLSAGATRSTLTNINADVTVTALKADANVALHDPLSTGGPAELKGPRTPNTMAAGRAPAVRIYQELFGGGMEERPFGFDHNTGEVDQGIIRQAAQISHLGRGDAVEAKLAPFFRDLTAPGGRVGGALDGKTLQDTLEKLRAEGFERFGAEGPGATDEHDIGRAQLDLARMLEGYRTPEGVEVPGHIQRNIAPWAGITPEQFADARKWYAQSMQVQSVLAGTDIDIPKLKRIYRNGGKDYMTGNARDIAWFADQPRNSNFIGSRIPSIAGGTAMREYTEGRFMRMLTILPRMTGMPQEALRVGKRSTRFAQRGIGAQESAKALAKRQDPNALAIGPATLSRGPGWLSSWWEEDLPPGARPAPPPTGETPLDPNRPRRTDVDPESRFRPGGGGVAFEQPPGEVRGATRTHPGQSRLQLGPAPDEAVVQRELEERLDKQFGPGGRAYVVGTAGTEKEQQAARDYVREFWARGGTAPPSLTQAAPRARSYELGTERGRAPERVITNEQIQEYFARTTPPRGEAYEVGSATPTAPPEEDPLRKALRERNTEASRAEEALRDPRTTNIREAIRAREQQLRGEQAPAAATTAPAAPSTPAPVTRARKAGDGIKHVILSDGKDVGNISGFERPDFRPGGGRTAFHMYRVGLREGSGVQGTGLFQRAVQEIANKYPGGAFVHAWEASPALKKALAKMPTSKVIGDRIYVLPTETPANLTDMDSDLQ